MSGVFMEWLESLESETIHKNDILSFEEYFKVLEKNSLQEIRPCCTYLKDMFDYFGRNERGCFNLFQQSLPNSPALRGQKYIQETLYHNLINFQEEGFNNKFLLLVGPNGSSKTTVIRKIMEGLETYSETEQGTLHTFSWIFPVESLVKGNLGLSSQQIKERLASYAHLEDKDISVILTSDVKDHPLLLIPLEKRKKLIEKLLRDHPQALETAKKSYLYYGDIAKRDRMIFDALLKNYKGDYAEVYKHIRVERYFANKMNSTGLVTIEPQLHVDARLQQITMDKRIANLPPSLQSLNLFNISGEIIMANRGVIEFSDLLKRPLDTFKYLLMTMETRSINLQGILTALDVFFIGSSNEIHLNAFKQHPDFNSFKGRFNFVRVPYLLNSKDEEKIYEEQILNLKDKIHFEPHALETLCLWAVMTRLRPSQRKNYENKTLGQLIETFNPLEKTQFLSLGFIPERFSSDQKKTLKTQAHLVHEEYYNDEVYEGKFGISPREMKQIIYELSTQLDNLSFVEILEFLDDLTQRKSEYSFLNQPSQGLYHDPQKFLSLLRDFALDNFDHEVRDSLGLIDDRSYSEYIERYITQIMSFIKKERIKNPITGKFEDADMYFIKEFEANLGLNEEADTFRSHMLSSLGAYSLDNPGQKIVYEKVFPDVVKKLKESFRNEQKKAVQEIANNIFFYLEDKNQKNKEKLKHKKYQSLNKLIENLTQKYHYTEKGCITLLQLLLKERY